MNLHLYNTLGRTKQRVTHDGRVRLYVCGVTPYETTHLGHARTYVVFDVLVRHLIGAGVKVDYVQNITDVDDSILRRAGEVDEPYDELGDRYTAVYLEDVAALGILPAGLYPKATSAILEMHEVTARLLRSGHAYDVDGDIYFRVSSAPTFGELSRLSRKKMLEVLADQDDASVGDPRKDDPLDFPLWRTQRQAEPAWDGPWGPGRPGWHIECSTLALKHLGPQIDIHGGGDDLIFPHHECEIVQSELVTGVRPFARLWMHVAMVRLGGEKMAKSVGNLVFARDLLARHHSDAVRLYLLSTHYRNALDYDDAALDRWSEIAEALAHAAGAAVTLGDEDSGEASTARARVLDALDDDLDTPAAIDALRVLAASVEAATARGDPAYERRRELRRLAGLLGLQLENRRR